MKNIEVSVLNPHAVLEAEQMMVAMARLTQRGHKISNTTDFYDLLNKDYSDRLVGNLAALPHPTIQKFGIINIMVIGASRRFLAQITRHQNEVKFMSGSLQYSDYSDTAQFVVPYELTVAAAKGVKVGPYPRAATPERTFEMIYMTPVDKYLHDCQLALASYAELAKLVGRDAAGYAMPQGMRNVLLISATPYQWKHMIGQRICRRNTLETRYVMLRCWEELYPLSDVFKKCGPSCLDGGCNEGRMSCSMPFEHDTPTEILNEDFEYIRR